MNQYYDKVRDYLLELSYNINHEDPADGLFVVSREEDGINNLVIFIAEPILIMEQTIFELKQANAEVLKSLLIKNRDIVFGAFALDNEGQRVIFRDTLALENLDLNELEGSINSLSLLLSEYGDEIIQFSKA